MSGWPAPSPRVPNPSRRFNLGSLVFTLPSGYVHAASAPHAAAQIPFEPRPRRLIAVRYRSGQPRVQVPLVPRERRGIMPPNPAPAVSVHTEFVNLREGALWRGPILPPRVLETPRLSPWRCRVSQHAPRGFHSRRVPHPWDGPVSLRPYTHAGAALHRVVPLSGGEGSREPFPLGMRGVVRGLPSPPQFPSAPQRPIRRCRSVALAALATWVPCTLRPSLIEQPDIARTRPFNASSVRTASSHLTAALCRAYTPPLPIGSSRAACVLHGTARCHVWACFRPRGCHSRRVRPSRHGELLARDRPSPAGSGRRISPSSGTVSRGPAPTASVPLGGDVVSSGPASPAGPVAPHLDRPS